MRIWSVAEHRLLAIRTLPLSVSALAYTSDGLHLAVGCVKGGMYILYADTLADALAFSLNALFRVGGPPLQYGTRPIAPSGSGSFAAAAAALDRTADVALSYSVSDSTALAASATGAAAAVSALAYSPDDSLLAVGGPDGTLEILAVGASYRRIHSCRGHSSSVLHVDWSSDGNYLQTCCARCELLFWDAQTGERILEPRTLCDVTWATWTCPLGLPVQGIYPKMSDGSDITAVHRSPDGRLLVTADDFRKVNLFAFPCGPGSAACRSTAVHAAHVASVRFTADGKHVISLGGPDLSVVVWRISGR